MNNSDNSQEKNMKEDDARDNSKPFNYARYMLKCTDIWKEGLKFVDNTCSRCKLCSRFFHGNNHALSHVLTKHFNKKPYSCRICQKAYYYPKSVKRHVMRVHDRSLADEKYKCKVCGAQKYSQSDFIIHSNSHGGKYLFKCHDCGKGFYSKVTVKVHIERVHIKENRILSIMCDICGAMFAFKSSFITHMNRVHHIGKKYPCSICNQICDSKSILDVHMTIHTGEHKYQCDFCSKTFRLFNALYSHVLRHSNPKRYKCPKCDSTFADKKTIKDHLLKHEGIRKYCCQVCGKTFAQSSHLDTHKFVHREKKFICSVCGARFNRNDNRKSHEKRHSAVKKIPIKKNPVKKVTASRPKGKSKKSALKKEAKVSEQDSAVRECVTSVVGTRKSQRLASAKITQ